MNILAIDYGTKNIGLAWCQTGLDVVLPFGKISEDKENVKLQKLSELIVKENIDKLVVGIPLGLNGEENNNTEIIREFIKKLQKMSNVGVDYVDERFTSRQADRMESGGTSRDERAAMIILQSYLNKIN